MNVKAQNELKSNSLYDIMRVVGWSFRGVLEDESGDGYIMEAVPLDDAAIFAAVTVGRKARFDFLDCLERTSGVKYHDLIDMDRKSVEDLQASLSASAAEEILRNARKAKTSFRITCQALAACVKERSSKIKFDYGDGLSPENFVGVWLALCTDHSSFRRLRSDLRDGAWLNQNKEDHRWRDLEKVVLDAIHTMRDCFDVDELTSQRSEGRSLISWPLEDFDEVRMEDAEPLLDQARSMWNSLRSDLLRDLDKHFEFHLTGGMDQTMEATNQS